MSNLNWDSWAVTKRRIQGQHHKFAVHNIVEFSQNHRDNDYNEILENANRLMQDVFSFRKPLDMEPCHIPYNLKSIGWEKSPNGDLEWLFMLHRQEYLLDLVIAYYETKDLAYIQKWKEFVLQWIDQNPLNENTKFISWRTIDTGIRCFQWCQSLLLILPLEILSEEEEKTIMFSMKKQLSYIYDAYIVKHDLSNWGVLQLAGAFVCESWFGDVLQLDMKDWSMKKLEVQLYLQVNDAGVHWEQSPLYQYETLFYFVSVIHHAQETNYFISERFLKRIKKLLQNSVHLCQPDGRLISQSDTDQTDISYLLHYSEVIMKENVVPFKQRGGKLIVAWLVGWDKFNAYLSQDDPKIHIPLSSYDMKTGNSWDRTGWDDAATFLTVHSGPVGSGHGHLDLGHFNFTYDGTPVFIDPGRFSYEEGPIRNYLKTSKSHNTIIIDNQNFSEAKGSWKYGDTAIPHTFNFIEKDEISITEIIYTTHLQDNSVCTVRRRFIFIKALTAVLIFDFVIANGSHKVRRSFHASTQINLEKDSTRKVKLITESEELYQHFFGNTEISIKDTFISPIYNSLANTKRIDASSNFSDYGSFLTVLAPKDISVHIDEVKQSGTDKAVDPLFMEAIVLKGKKTFTVLNGQLDTVHGDKIYLYKDHSVYGRLNIINNKDEIERYL